jgi:hypothetical protein
MATTELKINVIKRNPSWVTATVAKLLRMTGFDTTKGGKFNKTTGVNYYTRGAWCLWVKKVESVQWTWADGDDGDDGDDGSGWCQLSQSALVNLVALKCVLIHEPRAEKLNGTWDRFTWLSPSEYRALEDPKPEPITPPDIALFVEGYQMRLSSVCGKPGGVLFRSIHLNDMTKDPTKQWIPDGD